MTEQEIYQICSDFMTPSKEDKLLSTLVKALHQKFEGELVKQNKIVAKFYKKKHEQSLIDVERDMLNACEEYGVLVARSMFNEKLKKEGRDER